MSSAKISVHNVATYTGLFPTTSDAVIDAQERNPSARCISARVAP